LEYDLIRITPHFCELQTATRPISTFTDEVGSLKAAGNDQRITRGALVRMSEQAESLLFDHLLAKLLVIHASAAPGEDIG